MIAAEAMLAQRLRRMRWFAGGLLGLMLGLFLLATRARATYPGLEWVRAFAEAAMVGGLADWFAVTALFRHPLGLPIPHTAIVPKRKDAIGRALAGFLHDHFLERAAIERRLATLDLAARLGRWLGQPDSSRNLSRDLTRAFDWLLASHDGTALRAALAVGAADVLARVRLGTVLAAAVRMLGSGPHAQTLLDEVVQIAYAQLEANKERIRSRIHERSPWWLPRFVDEEIYDRLVQECERILGEIRANPAHEARQQLVAQLERLAATLADDAELEHRGRALRDEFLAHPAVRSYGSDLARALQTYLHEALAQPDSALRAGIEQELVALGRVLAEDGSAQQTLDAWLRELLLYLVETYRRPLSEVVSSTIAEWDPGAAAQRIELYLGRDLQFIRINGTLVGGLVGVAIYGLARLLGA
jgi:uncharacterized membrane-anchored protein YjiN (DUF445 family)